MSINKHVQIVVSHRLTNMEIKTIFMVRPSIIGIYSMWNGLVRARGISKLGMVGKAGREMVGQQERTGGRTVRKAGKAGKQEWQEGKKVGKQERQER